jgi:hypothetical protein
MKTQDAIDFFGSREALAEKLGIDRSATHHWGDIVPELRQYQIQVLSKGKLKASTQAKRKEAA